MTDGTAFILSCLRDKDYKTFSSVADSWYFDAEEGYKFFVTKYLKDYGSFPTENVFISNFSADLKGTTPKQYEGSPNFYKEKCKSRYVYVQLVELPNILKSAKKDPMAALEDIRLHIAALETSDNLIKDIRHDSNKLKRIEEYEERQENMGITYMSTGSDILDSQLHGYQRGDLITIAARSGLGKTFLLCYLAILAEKANPHYGDILFITNEMPINEIQGRMDAIQFNLPYSEFLTGTLSKSDEKRYRVQLSKQKSNIIFVNNVSKLTELESRVKIYQPSSVFLDGSYLMEKKSQKDNWERILQITQGLKQIGLSQNIPIINTTQLKKGSGKKKSEYSLDAQEDFAYSGSYIQDSDVAIPLYQTPEMQYNSIVGAQYAKGRRLDPKASFDWYFNPDDMNFKIIEHEDVDLTPIIV